MHAVHPERVDLLIRNVTVVSAERAAPLENAWVAIDGARIVAIGLDARQPERIS